MIIFSYNLVSGIPLNKINISDIKTNNIYKIQSKIILNQFSEKEILVNKTPYQTLTLPNYGYIPEIEKPKLPAIRFLLAVPSVSNISLKLTESNYSVLAKDYNIYPVQEPVFYYEKPKRKCYQKNK